MRIVHVIWNGEYVMTQSMLHPMVVFVPNVPVPDPAAPELVPPPVLAAGTTPETVPWSWGDAIAEDQSPAGPTEAKFESDVSNWLECAAHCPWSVATQPPVLEDPWNFRAIDPFIAGVPLATQVVTL